MLYNAIEPFLIFQQNDYRPTAFYYEEEDRMDITRGFDIDAPTEVDTKQRVLQWERRHPNSPQNGDTSSVSSQNGRNAPSSTSTKKKSDSMKKNNLQLRNHQG